MNNERNAYHQSRIKLWERLKLPIKERLDTTAERFPQLLNPSEGEGEISLAGIYSRMTQYDLDMLKEADKTIAYHQQKLTK